MTVGDGSPVQDFRVRVLRMNALANGIAAGVLSGGALFLLTVWLVLKGGRVVGPHLALLGQYFVGYSVTWPGAFIGLGYGFVTGFVVGTVGSLVYNAALRGRDRAS